MSFLTLITVGILAFANYAYSMGTDLDMVAILKAKCEGPESPLYRKHELAVKCWFMEGNSLSAQYLSAQRTCVMKFNGGSPNVECPDPEKYWSQVQACISEDITEERYFSEIAPLKTCWQRVINENMENETAPKPPMEDESEPPKDLIEEPMMPNDMVEPQQPTVILMPPEPMDMLQNVNTSAPNESNNNENNSTMSPEKENKDESKEESSEEESSEEDESDEDSSSDESSDRKTTIVIRNGAKSRIEAVLIKFRSHILNNLVPNYHYDYHYPGNLENDQEYHYEPGMDIERGMDETTVFEEKMRMLPDDERFQAMMNNDDDEMMSEDDEDIVI